MRRPIPGLAPRFWLAGLHAALGLFIPACVAAAAPPEAPPSALPLVETPWNAEPDEISVTGLGVQAFFADGGLVESDHGLPLWGVGLLLDGEGVGRLTWQGQNLQGLWTVPRPVEVTWSEGRAHVARIRFDEPMRRARLFRNGASVSFAQLEPLYERRPEGLPLARELPRLTLLQVKAGASSKAAPLPPGVVSRAQWGARNTGPCGSSHRPQYLTIHHTATPNNDSFTPAARMRQMQAYHIDNRGWCDFGYHFTVGIDGRVYQGRDPDATGAHVGDWNTNNVGISVVGTFTDTPPRQTQLDALTDISRWVVNRYGIPRSRNNIRGHKEWPGHTTNSCPGLILPWLNTLVTRLNPTPPPPVATLLDGFETSVGRFASAPTFSGSTVGIARSSTAQRSELQARSGEASLQVLLRDDPDRRADWFVRLLSGGGAPAQNPVLQKAGGRLGAWFYTAATGVSVSFAVDDSDGTERSRPVALTKDAWTFVEVKLDDQSQWDAWTEGDGTISAGSVTLDSIIVQRAETAFDVYVYIDDVGFRVQR